MQIIMPSLVILAVLSNQDIAFLQLQNATVSCYRNSRCTQIVWVLWPFLKYTNMYPHMNFFALHKKSCQGQRASVFSSRSGLWLWMTFITWTSSLFIKNHVMIYVQVFSQVVVVFNFEWHSSHELFSLFIKNILWSTRKCFLKS